MSPSFNINQFVWAKLQGFPAWPAIIVEPGSNTPLKPAKLPNIQMYWVYFFGTHNYAWIEEKNVKDYQKHKDKFENLNKMQSFKDAMVETDLHIENLKEDPEYKIPRKEQEKVQKPQKRKQVSRKSVKKRSKFSSKADDEQTFGVIGLGSVGTKLVLTLIKSGHKVNVWNRTAAKYRNVQIEAEQENESNLEWCENFQSVILNSDITFICVSDQNALKKIIQDTFEIDSTNAVFQDKGLVEMTTINSETSKYIGNIIKNKGGRYLETQIQSSGIKEFTLEDLAKGYLPKSLLLTAGDKNLFDECQQYFREFSDKAVYLGDVGSAANLNLILQMISATSLAGLAEGMALAETCGIDPKEFIIIIASAPFSSNFTRSKSKNIADGNYERVDQSLESMERSLKLGLDLTNDLLQPMSIISKVKEIFSHCCKLRYGQSDVSAIYMRNRH